MKLLIRIISVAAGYLAGTAVVWIGVLATAPMMIPYESGCGRAAILVPLTAAAFSFVARPRASVLLIYGITCAAIFIPQTLGLECYGSELPFGTTYRGVELYIGTILAFSGGCCVVVGYMVTICKTPDAPEMQRPGPVPEAEDLEK